MVFTGFTTALPRGGLFRGGLCHLLKAACWRAVGVAMGRRWVSVEHVGVLPLETCVRAMAIVSHG